MTPNVFFWPNFGFVFVNAFLYEYDFYDNWKHDIRLEKVLPLNSKRVFPICIGGQRPVPPEDSGGPRAYREEEDPGWRTWWDAFPREDLELIAETVKRFPDSKGDRSIIEDRENLIVAVDRVKAHSDRRPDRINRRVINQRLQQYAVGKRKWLFCESIG
jgi:Plasmid pRiA4b ORF-3-like protein